MPLSFSPASSAYSFQGETLVFPNTSTLQSLQRAVQASQLTLHPRLHSIADDAAFLASLLPHYPPYPRLANLHCGAWYLPPSLCSQQPSTCYFKSSDSHCYHWTFSVTRCNPHVIDLCGREGGVVIVDATRMGKRFPDSFSRTIPIWCCVVNRAIARWRKRTGTAVSAREESARRGEEAEDGGQREKAEDEEGEDEWDEELHTPEWVSDTEKAQILQRLDEWVLTFTSAGFDLGRFSALLSRPLRPLWIDRSTPVPQSPSEYADLPFLPLLLVNPSPPSLPSSPRLPCPHVQGAGDDEVNWARGLTPALFWAHAPNLLSLPPIDCEEAVDALVRAPPGCSVSPSPVRYPVGDTGLTLVSGAVGPAQDGLARLYLVTELDRAKAHALTRGRRGGRKAGAGDVEAEETEALELRLEVSGALKDKRAVKDVLGPAVAFMLRHRGQGRSVEVVGEWGVGTAVVVAALISGWNEAYLWVGEDGEGVMARRVSKGLIRVVSNFVHACMADVFPSRLTLKQLNQHFLTSF